MAVEFWHEFGADLGITLTPAGGGRLEVLLDGKMLFDRKAEDGKYPDLTRVRELKMKVQEMLAQKTPARAR